MLSWWIAGTLVRGWAVVAASGGGLLALIAAGRAILLWLKDLRPGATSINVARAANIAGLILGFLFLLLCATFVQVVVFYGGGFLTGTPPVNEPEIWATQSAARLGLLALPFLLYIILTGWQSRLPQRVLAAQLLPRPVDAQLCERRQRRARLPARTRWRRTRQARSTR